MCVSDSRRRVQYTLQNILVCRNSYNSYTNQPEDPLTAPHATPASITRTAASKPTSPHQDLTISPRHGGRLEDHTGQSLLSPCRWNDVRTSCQAPRSSAAAQPVARQQSFWSFKRSSPSGWSEMTSPSVGPSRTPISNPLSYQHQWQAVMMDIIEEKPYSAALISLEMGL
jgi:hypothetical protein